MLRQIVSGVLLCGCVSAASAAGLEVGDPAPELAVETFIKGQPVRAFEKGKVYVVEFWATWCGPCRRTIPHLTRLQKRHGDVVFIGVSVWEKDQAGVKPFVEKMGAKMDYRVAIDAVPKGAEYTRGAMAMNWMQATEEVGLPTAFIVDRSTRIAWIGDPASLERPLAQVVAGTWSLAKGVAARRTLIDLRVNVRKAEKSGDPKQMLAVLDEAMAADPDLEPVAASLKFTILLREINDEEKALVYGRRLVEEVLKDDAEGLRDLSWSIVDPKAPRASPKMAGLAVAAALRADTVSGGKDAAIAATLAKAYFDSGDAARAVAAQERAVKLAKGTELDKDSELRQRLDQYRKAAGRQ